MKRYQADFPLPTEAQNGSWVRYEDAQAEVERLKSKLAEYESGESELLTIAYMHGSSSKNDRVRELEQERDELKAQIAQLENDLRQKKLIHIGFTNENQISYIADDSGSVYPDTDNDCFIPVYMLENHVNRLGAEKYELFHELRKERDQLRAELGLRPQSEVK